MAKSNLSVNFGFLNTATPPEAPEMEGQSSVLTNMVRLAGRLAARGAIADSGYTGADSAQLMTSYAYRDDSSGDVYEFDIAKLSDGSIVAASASVGSFVTVATGCGVSRGSFWQRGNYLYYTSNSLNLCLEYTGSSWAASTIGADAPTSACGVAAQSSVGRMSPGGYVYAVSAFDEDRRCWSLRSPVSARAVLDATSDSVLVSWGSSSITVGGKKAKKVLLWRTRAYANPTGTVAFDKAPQMVTVADNIGYYGDVLPDESLGPQYGGLGGIPPLTDISCYSNERAWYLTGGTLWFSERGRPEMVAQDDDRSFMGRFIPRPYGESRRDIPGVGTAVADHNGRTYVWTTKETYMVVGDGPNARLQSLNLGVGCAYHHSVVSCKYGLFWLSSDGLCLLRGNEFVNLTKDVIAFDSGDTACLRSDWNGGAVACYDSANELYILNLTTASPSASTPRFLLVYDCRRNGFLKWVVGGGSGADICGLGEYRLQSGESRLVAGVNSAAMAVYGSGLVDVGSSYVAAHAVAWFGQNSYENDKLWNAPEFLFYPGSSGTVSINMQGNEMASETDANVSSFTVSANDSSPQTVAEAGAVHGRLLRFELSHAGGSKFGLTGLSIEPQTGDGAGEGVDKA